MWTYPIIDETYLKNNALLFPSHFPLWNTSFLSVCDFKLGALDSLSYGTLRTCGFWVAVKDSGFIHDLYTYITGICCQVEACPWLVLSPDAPVPVSLLLREDYLPWSSFAWSHGWVWGYEKRQSHLERSGFPRAGQLVAIWQLLNKSTKWLNEANFWNRSYVYPEL